MRQCAGTKRDGSLCTATVEPPSAYCWWHDPANAEERKRAASRGGKVKPKSEVSRLKADVREVIAKIERGDLPRNDGAVMLQGYRVLKDVIELARKIKATEKLTEQINALRRRVDGQRGAER